MDTLPDALAALAHYRQFITWKLVDDGPNKKPKKLPTSPTTGQPIDVTDAGSYTDFHTACQGARMFGPNAGVGFVLTENDPFYCIDVDACYDGGVWSPISRQLLEQFNGCGVEFSHSGRGVHIFGTGQVPAHKKRNQLFNIELYTENRFIALTGRGAIGNVLTELPDKIAWLVASYFKPDAEPPPTDWTGGPSPLWRGPADDGELIKKMLSARAASTIFGNGSTCTLRDLWEGNEEKIAMIYPATGDESCLYDRSIADAALCLQLAWWTGGDCERIERLFNLSGLVREKWRDRPKYRRETILGAVAKCQGCLGADVARQEANRVHWEPPPASNTEVFNSDIALLGGARVIAFQDRPKFFANHYYLRLTNQVLCPDGVRRDMTDYNGCYAGYEFLQQTSGQKPVKKPWEAYVTAPDVKRLEAHDVIYRPAAPFMSPVIRGKRVYVNIYENFDIPRVVGDPSPFLNHVYKLLPNGDDAVILLSWLAAFVQYPGVKFRWSPFIQGAEGCGKSIISQTLAAIIGEDHVYMINPEDFCQTGAKFNAWVQRSRLAVIEELSVGARNQSDAALKRYIDHGRIELQGKGADQVTVEICCNIIINSNFKDGLPIHASSRRYAPLFCAQQTAEDVERAGMGGEYFHKLVNWLQNEQGFNIVAHCLDTYQIPYKYNPATGAIRAPRTSSLDAAIGESMAPVEASIRDALASGERGTLGGWVSLVALRKIIESDGVLIRSMKQITTVLNALGYVTHPALDHSRGRTTQPIANEGQRTKLYLTPGHPALTAYTTGGEVCQAYREAQGYLPLPIGVLKP